MGGARSANQRGVMKEAKEGLKELGASAIGRRLTKYFDGEPYGGEVVEYVASKRWYLVTYDDGDQEDMLWKDLSTLLVVDCETNVIEPEELTVTTTRSPAKAPAPKPRAPKPRLPQPVEEPVKGKTREPKVQASPFLSRSPPGPSSEPKDAIKASSEDPASTTVSGSELAIQRRAVPGGKAVEACIAEYNRLRLEATEEENARVANGNGKNPDGKKQSRRPDLVAMKKLRDQGGGLAKNKVAGDIPGIPVGFKFWSRAEMAVTGAHFAPVSGIEYVTGSQDKAGGYVTSVVMSGNYEGGHGDENAAEGMIVYDGAGGCNLLHDRKQIADQTLDRGNLAFTGNHERGIPVRVTRKNKCPESYTKSSFTYDGLWDVVEWWSERPQTDFNPGFLVYRYRLKRREGQPKLTILTQAEEKVVQEKVREAARERREEEKAQKQATDQLVREAVKQTKAAARETVKQTKAAARESVKQSKAAEREAVKQSKAATKAAIMETKAVLKEARQAASRPAGLKRKAPSPDTDSPSERSSESAQTTAAGLRRAGSEMAVTALVSPEHDQSQREEEPAEGPDLPARPQPRTLDSWTPCVPAALGVAEFLGSFGDLIVGAGAEGLPRKALDLALLPSTEGSGGGAWDMAQEWFLPLCKALLLKAVPLSAKVDEVRSERWQEMLRASPLPTIRDALTVALLRRSGCIPGASSEEPGAPPPRVEDLSVPCLLNALESLCSAATAAPELRSAIEERMQQRAELQKELQNWSKAERRRVQEAEATERAVQEEAIARAAEEIRRKAKGPAVEGLALEELRRMQRDAKEQADALGKLRTEARRAVAAAAAEAAESFVAESQQRLREAERRSAALAVRRAPLGRDSDGQGYWWLPAAAPGLVLLESAEGEWTGSYKKADLPELLEALDPDDDDEGGLRDALRRVLGSMEGDEAEGDVGIGSAEDLVKAADKEPIPGKSAARSKRPRGASKPEDVAAAYDDVEASKAAAAVLEFCRVVAESVTALTAAKTTGGGGSRGCMGDGEESRKRLLEAEASLCEVLKPPASPQAAGEGNKETNGTEEEEGEEEAVDGEKENHPPPTGKQQDRSEGDGRPDGAAMDVDDAADERYLDLEDPQRRRALLKEGLWPEGPEVREAWRRELEGPGGALQCSQAYLAAVLAERAWPMLKPRLAKAGASLDEIMGLRVTRARKRKAAAE